MGFDHFLGPGRGLDDAIRMGALVMARGIPMLFLNPFLGGTSVPGPVKMGMAGTMSLLVLPSLLRTADMIPAGPAYGFLMMKEVCIGLVLGYLSALVFWAIATAGRLVDTQRGANMAETMVFQLRDRTSYMGQLQFQAAIVLFLVLNGHLVYLQAYAHSFEMVPPLRFPPLDGTGLALDEIVRATSGLFVTALQLAVPAVIVVFLIDVGFGILNRLSPSVNVFSLSQPVKMLAGLLVTVLVLPALFLLLQDRMAEMLALVSRFIDAIGGAGP